MRCLINWKQKIKNWELKTPKIKIKNETSATLSLDGDSGLGIVTAPKAMKMAIEKAKEDYKVSITPDLEIDENATAKLRNN